MGIKLIEVALPLDAINVASAREKSIRHGHPSTLHLWWARRPLAACRAVLFAQIVDDPLARILADAVPDRGGPGAPSASGCSDHRRAGEVGEHHQRDGARARPAPRSCAATDGNPPPVLDPFAGGGSIPLEAQRLGLEAHASDLNPVAVLINKAMIEIPPKFAGKPPVNPDRRELAHRREVEGRRRAGRGRALLRPVDARRGREAHRPPLPEGARCREQGGARRRDRLALGAHREMPEPGLRSGDAARLDRFSSRQRRARRLDEPVVDWRVHYVRVDRPRRLRYWSKPLEDGTGIEGTLRDVASVWNPQSLRTFASEGTSG